MIFDIIYISCFIIAIVCLLIADFIDSRMRYDILVDDRYFENVKVEFSFFTNELVIHSDCETVVRYKTYTILDSWKEKKKDRG